MKHRNLPIYLGAIGLIIFLAAMGWQTVETKHFVSETTLTAVAPMPNLDGEQAKEYLEQNNLSRSLNEAVQTARYAVNRVERASLRNTDGAFEAKNPQQGFAAYFTNDEVNLVSDEAMEKWNFSLTLKGYGRGERVESVSDGEIKTEGNRVEISRSNIVEWYENKPDGLEQGFTINEPPTKEQRFIPRRNRHFGRYSDCWFIRFTGHSANLPARRRRRG